MNTYQALCLVAILVCAGILWSLVHLVGEALDMLEQIRDVLLEDRRTQHRQDPESLLMERLGSTLGRSYASRGGGT